MAQYLELSEVKAHLLVDSNDDDAYISQLMEVAERAVEVDLDIELTELVSREGSLPAPVKQAMMLLIGNLYANREPVAMGAAANKVPYTYDYLKGLFKNYPLS
jgi:hypothetical protein